MSLPPGRRVAVRARCRARCWSGGFRARPLPGSMYFHVPCRNAKAARLFDQRRASRRGRPDQRRQHVVAVDAPRRGPAAPAMSQTRRRRSTCDTRAADTPGVTRAGQRTIRGTRVPPSNALYLPPLRSSGRPMRSQLRHRVVLVTVVDDRAVVAREDHQGVIGQLQPVECAAGSGRRPNRSVRSHRRAAPCPSCRRSADGALAAHAGRAWRRTGRTARSADALDELDGVAGEDVGHVLVTPERRAPAGHVADAADAVDDRLVVAVARVYAQAFSGLRACRSASLRPARRSALTIGSDGSSPTTRPFST